MAMFPRSAKVVHVTTPAEFDAALDNSDQVIVEGDDDLPTYAIGKASGDAMRHTVARPSIIDRTGERLGLSHRKEAPMAELPTVEEATRAVLAAVQHGYSRCGRQSPLPAGAQQLPPYLGQHVADFVG